MERLKDLEKEFRETGYREDRMEKGFEGLKEKVAQIGVETDRDNANVGNNFSAKLLRIASVTNRAFNIDQLPTYLAMPHLNGDIYYHDLDSYNLTTKDRKSTRLNSSHANISYAVFCLKKKRKTK